jgi:hypothetical protein
MMRKWLSDSAVFFGIFGRPPERRAAPRYDVRVDVWLRRPGLTPVAGSAINISVGGAAIRVHGWNVPVPSAWPTRLNHGDELTVMGLLDKPVPCWAIAIHEGVLRVHFSLDDTMRHQLSDMISALPHDEPARPH